MDIVFESSKWFILLCFLLGLTYSVLLYYKDKSLDYSSIWLIRASFFLRFISITLIAFLLLNPLVKSLEINLEKPILIFAQDNSTSILLNKDSTFYKKNYKTKVNKLLQNLKADYTIKTYSFGDKVTDSLNFDYKATSTNYFKLFSEINNQFINRNLGAIILASDGIYNQGSNPIYALNKINTPIFTLGLGDNSIPKDIAITDVKHNDIAFVGNQIPLEIYLLITELKGAHYKVTVSHNGNSVFETSEKIESNKSSKKISLYVEATAAGIQKYIVTVSHLKNEITYTNNSFEVFIDIINGRQKILILSSVPHPDIFALKSLIEINDNYKVITKLFPEFDGVVAPYNLVILNQLPSNKCNVTSLFKKLNEKKIPQLLLLGANTNLNQFNQLQLGLNISKSRGNTNEVLAAVNPDFTDFLLSNETKNTINNFPPLTTPFGAYKTSQTTNSLLFQSIGKIKTTQPLLLFNEKQGVKTGILTGEGLWHWKIVDYQQNKNHNAITELINKTVQYLSLKENKKRFKVLVNKQYFENEALIFNAELYNKNYELVTSSDVSLLLKDKNDKEYSYQFSPVNQKYKLNLGVLSVGNYTYESQVRFGGVFFTEKGKITIKPIQLEALNTQANFTLLKELSNNTGGKFIPKENFNSITSELKKLHLKPIAHSQKTLTEIINWKWLFFMILAFISIEWFLRKQNGGY